MNLASHKRMSFIISSFFAGISGAMLAMYQASVQATAHRWLYADTAPPLNVDGWWQPETGLGLCGDWLHNGTVEGAWVSGRHLAQRVHTTLATRTA